jgi:L-fucose mutarotase
MFKTKLTNPEILSALSMCGHGSKILISDANYPLEQKTGNCKKVYVGIMPGLPTVTDVLKAIHSVVEIEKAEVMVPEDGSRPEVFDEFEEELGMKLETAGRYEYYDMCASPDVYLAIQTGEKRTFSNIMVTVGCAWQ